MALNKKDLTDNLEAAFANTPGKTAKATAELIASAIDAYVRSATVNTTVSGVCPSGVVTGSGVGSLS